MGRAAIFFFNVFWVIFTSLIENLTRGTPPYKMKFDSVATSSFLIKFYGIDFVSKLNPY